MAPKPKYIFIARMDIDPEKEADFNRIYDTEHIPSLLEVPGVIDVTRYEAVQGEPKYAAIYELESPEVMASDAWREAVEKGQWPSLIRPYTKNRSHALYRRIDSAE